MGRTVKLMVCCGSGIATSTHVAAMVREYMEKRCSPVTIETCSVQDLANRLTGCDMILSTTQVAFGTEIPVFSGVPLLIGVGEEEVLEAMAVKMKEISEG